MRNQIVMLNQKHAAKLSSEKKQLEEHYEDKIRFITQDYQTKIFIL